jgi:ABC-type multidrug transport system fused ATPase/permease subunit
MSFGAEHLRVGGPQLLLLRIWFHLPVKRRTQLLLSLLVMLASGLAELASLGSVLPFLGVLSDPTLLWRQGWIQVVAGWAGWTKPGHLLLPAIALFVITAVAAAVVRSFNLWLNGRMAAAIGTDLSAEAYRRTLYQPYCIHVQRNSASLINVFTNQVGHTVFVINKLLQMATALVVSLALIAGLFLIDWKVALSLAFLFVSAYSVLALFTRRELSSNSELMAKGGRQLLKVLQEGLGAIRDVLLEGNQSVFINIYRRADKLQRLRLARYEFLAFSPRFWLEAFGMVAIAVLGGLLVLGREGSGSVIPLLGTLALGAQRLLPALQQVYAGWSALKGFNSELAGVVTLLDQPMPEQVPISEPLRLCSGIRLCAVHFRYTPDQPEVLKGLDLEIRRGERIGLIGNTGSGKSTTVDVLMGLLEPTAGYLFVDGQDVHDSGVPELLSAWRAAIAHVPQTTYLADSSVAENIAFGIPRSYIDISRVREAARQAQISGFIESCPGSYDTFVGERGVRLSGGQRQRIGIARALYKQAQVLVLDEATSALDHETEQSVMDAIHHLSKDLTIVMIAHRLSTLSSCNRIIRIEDGVAVPVQSSLSENELIS